MFSFINWGLERLPESVSVNRSFHQIIDIQLCSLMFVIILTTLTRVYFILLIFLLSSKALSINICSVELNCFSYLSLMGISVCVHPWGHTVLAITKRNFILPSSVPKWQIDFSLSVWQHQGQKEQRLKRPQRFLALSVRLLRISGPLLRMPGPLLRTQSLVSRPRWLASVVLLLCKNPRRLLSPKRRGLQGKRAWW